jgi:hypothetical protein
MRSIVAYYSELDLQNQRKAAPASLTDETLREFSPVHHLRNNEKSVPPIFIARPGLDDAELNDGIDRFGQLALSRNLTVEGSITPRDTHAFDIEDNNERSREIIK